MSNNSKEEPKTAPSPDCWYDLVLGPSFKDDSSNKFCTLRYEFKPASIDKTRSGTLQKNKDNRVSVEFQNNQPGKSKVTFEGSSEDYKENDAVLFFDGQTFRLERLHRAVKQLRHLRMAGESAAASQAAVSMEPPRLSPVVNRGSKPSHMDRTLHPAASVEVERIEIGKPKTSGPKFNGKAIAAEPSNPESGYAVSPPGQDKNVYGVSPPDQDKNDDEGDEHHEIDLVDIFGTLTPETEKAVEENTDEGDDMDIGEQHGGVEEEIADVDDESGDEGEMGLNAAEALRAQVNAEGQNKQSSSSSTSSGSRSSSVSGSGSSSQSSSASSSARSGSSHQEDDDEVSV